MVNSDTATEPTKTAQDLVRVLAFRESLGTSYVTHAPRGRALLVVPTMMTGSPLERLRALSWKTVRAAIASGLVEVQPDSEHHSGEAPVKPGPIGGSWPKLPNASASAPLPAF